MSDMSACHVTLVKLVFVNKIRRISHFETVRFYNDKEDFEV